MFDKYLSSFRQAIDSLKANKVRSFLTMLGIIIGVSSVIIMLLVGKGTQALINNEIKDLGSNFVILQTGSFAEISAALTNLKNSDIDAMRKKGNLESLKVLASYTSIARVQVQEGTNPEIGINVLGADREYFDIISVDFEEGGLWTLDDEKALKKVVVLGGKVVKDIYGDNYGKLVGKSIKLKNQNYKIVGVMKEKTSALGQLMGDDNNQSVFTPREISQKFLFGGIDYVMGAILEAVSSDQVASLKDQTTAFLRERHKIRKDKEDDFSIQTQDEVLNIFGVVTGTFTLFLSALAGISLLVGGIGIMNIMLVVVTERIREIGLRKAIGASKFDILSQFVIEAMIITGLGGIAGIIVGVGFSYIITALGNITFIFDIFTILIAFVGSAMFGLAFGIYPAYKAANMDPIEALRKQ